MNNSKFKKGMATTLAAALICSVLPTQVHASDISGHWAEETMKQWVADGLLKGDGENYHPNDAVTRAQFMAFTNRALKLTETAPVDQFKDVKPGDWFYEDVARAVKAGYTNGTSTDTMSPWANITNQQMYAILGRLATEDGTADLSVIKDLDSVDDWALEDLEDAVASGYVVGSHGKVNPDKLATRAQAITILDRLMRDSRYFALPGVYTVDAREVTVMDDGIILRDCNIAGDLILKKGVKSVRLDNVTVGGQIIREDEGTQIMEASDQWQDGTYEGVAMGQNGQIRVKVTVKDGKIASAAVLEHHEDTTGEIMMSTVMRQINQTGDIKNIKFGNDQTINSDGVLNAVKDALSQASGQTLKPGQSREAQLYTTMKDGTYIGEANGYGGRMRVQLVVKDGKIADLNILSHSEDESYMVISRKLLTQIVDNDGTNGIDTITGATTTTRAMIRATDDAMSQAYGKTNAPGESPESILGGGHSGGLGNADKPAGQDFADKLRDGVYTGQAYGYGGLIKVTVTVENKKISKVVVTDHNETDSYYDKAKDMPGRIVEANSTNVDTITGATATSRGILAAVEDALKEFMVQVEHADGVWYGQGRGYYPNDLYKFGQLVRTASEMAVTVTDGKVSHVEVIYHGDDEHYHKYLMEKFDVFEQYIIDHNGTDGIIDIMNQADMSNPVFDAVSGATMSARGYVAAIDDALRRSDKYSLDGQEQTIRSLTLLNNPGYTVPPTQFYYGEEVDFSGLKVLVKYRDGREETVPFAELKSRGIACTLDVKFTPQPAHGDYSEPTNYDLVFTDPVSTAQHRSELQAKRMKVYRDIGKIQFTTGEGELVEVVPNDESFVYTVDLKKENMHGVTDVKVYDIAGEELKLKDFSLDTDNGKPVLRVNLEPLPSVKPSDPYEPAYRYNSYKIKIHMDAQFDKDKIHDFSIYNKPVTEYEVGENLNLSKLQILVVDENYYDEIVNFEDLEAHGFTVARSDGKPLEDGMLLNEGGQFDIVVTHTATKISHKVTITVEAEKVAMNAIVIRNKDGDLIKTIIDPPHNSENDYNTFTIPVPAEYLEDTKNKLDIQVIDVNGGTIPAELFWVGSAVSVTAADELTYNLIFEEGERAPSTLGSLEIRTKEGALLQSIIDPDNNVGNEYDSFVVQVPEEYLTDTENKLTVSAMDINGNDMQAEILWNGTMVGVTVPGADGKMYIINFSKPTEPKPEIELVAKIEIRTKSGTVLATIEDPENHPDNDFDSFHVQIPEEYLTDTENKLDIVALNVENEDLKAELFWVNAAASVTIPNYKTYNIFFEKGTAEKPQADLIVGNIKITAADGTVLADIDDPEHNEANDYDTFYISVDAAYLTDDISKSTITLVDGKGNPMKNVESTWYGQAVSIYVTGYKTFNVVFEGAVANDSQ